ncbi:Circadian clock-controlled protein [Papilio machaon]|uniref:Circadian clock-controlled protein n=1 Tax=Papilio machaon TaxID=76193 RepID=A0A194RGJ2_PAPMA|nr:Circadian clock-controlled protein [Papilio machaon]
MIGPVLLASRILPQPRALVHLAGLPTLRQPILLAQYVPVCDRNSPDVNDCLIDAVKKGLVAMKNGIKDLGVPAIDPYHQKELKMEYTNNQASISGKVLVTDTYVEGVIESTVKDVRLRAEDDSFHMEIDMFSPQIFCKGRFSGGGSYNVLRVNASGDFNTTMSDLTYTWKLDGTPEQIDGETYVRIKSFYMRPDVGNMVTHMTNENPDSKELTDLAIRITNENWRLLYRELLPFAQSNWNKIGIRIANKIFLKVPYNQLFPIKS